MNILRPADRRRTRLNEFEENINVFKQDIKNVKDAVVPDEEYRARVKARIEYAMYQKTPELVFNTLQGRFESNVVLPDAIDFAMLGYLFGVDEIVDRIVDRVKANGHPAGLPASERAKCIEKLQAQLRSAERDAEIEALRLEAAGHTILRREDADVEVLLEVWSNLPADAPQSASAAIRA